MRTEAVFLAMNSFALMGFWRSAPLIDRLFHDVLRMFDGRHPNYLPVDMAYHDLQHTLETSVCLCKILEGRHSAAAHPPLQRRDCELALAAALLHDAGYLKHAGDNEGTGAKYSEVHVSRSCAVARMHLPTIGFSSSEVEEACVIINCTAASPQIQSFPRAETKIMAAMVVTADYLGQMASSDYVSKLPLLYRELRESYAQRQSGRPEPQFKDEGEFIRQAPAFWDKTVKPMLERDLLGVYHYLAPGADGTIPYVTAIEQNIARIRKSMSESDNKTTSPDGMTPPAISDRDKNCRPGR